jgi:hypothetical protein
MTTTFINTKGPIDHTYLSHFKGQSVVVYARSLYEAKQRAIEHFKPKKRDAGLLAVNLHELGEGRNVVVDHTMELA